jgi:hypothetical protein
MRVFRLLIVSAVMLLVIGINTSVVGNEPVVTGYAYLQQFVGTWTGTASIWEAPGAEPITSPYVATSQMILDGKYLETKITGTYMGMPFEGIQIIGYSIATDKFTIQWISNLTSDFCISEGTLDETGKIRTDIADSEDCPICPSAEGFEMVTHLIDNDHFSITQYHSGYGPEQYKALEITYTRTE